MPTLLQVYRVNTVGADLHHLAPAVAERTPSERNLTHTTSAPGPSLPRTPRTFAQLEKCYDYLKHMDDGQVWPMPAYHEEILYPDDAHLPRQPAFQDGLRTMLQESMPRLQKYFSRKISDEACDALLDKVKHHEGNLATTEPSHRALQRLHNMSKSSYMGLYLDTLPRFGRKLSWDQAVAHARYRYGIPQLNVIHPMPSGPPVLKRCGGRSHDNDNAQCPQLLDSFGDHQTSCKSGPWSATSRHSYLTRAIARSLTGLPGIQGHTEVIIDNRAGSTCENRADITIFEGMSGPDRPDNRTPVLPLHLDVSIVQAGRLVQAERTKILKHASLCEATGASFLPLIFDSWGQTGRGFRDFMDLFLRATSRKGYTRDAWGSLKAPRVRARNNLLKEISWTLAMSTAGMLSDKAKYGSYELPDQSSFVQERQPRDAGPQRANPEATAAFPPLPTPRAPPRSPRSGEITETFEGMRKRLLEIRHKKDKEARRNRRARVKTYTAEAKRQHSIRELKRMYECARLLEPLSDSDSSDSDSSDSDISDEDATVNVIGGTTLNTVEATTVPVPVAATTVPMPADDDAMNIVENAPIPALGMVACLPTVRRESVRLKARRQPTGSLSHPARGPVTRSRAGCASSVAD